MYREIILVNFLVILFGELCGGQVIQFGQCIDVQTVQYFDLERFLGEWYEIERFPTWYEHYGNCAYKRLQYCGRRVEIEHIFVKDDIQFILHVNSSYAPGDEAVFVIQENNIDPIGIPLSVISTDYTSYAVVYGCKYNEDMRIKYILAWILSRTTSLPEETLRKARQELSSVTYISMAYLQKVEHNEAKCSYYWTAHVQAENITNTERTLHEVDGF